MPHLEKNDSDGSVKEVLQTDYANGICDANLVERKIDSPHSVISPSMEQFPCSTSPEVDADLGVTRASESSDVVNPVHMNSEVDDVIAGVNSENLLGIIESPEVDSITEQQCSDITVDVSQVEHDSIEVGVTYSEKMSPEETSGADGGEELVGCVSKLGVVGEDSASFEHPANYSDKLILNEHVNLEEVGAFPVSVTVATGANDGVNDASCLYSELVCSSSSNLTDIEGSHIANGGPHQNLDFDEGVFAEYYPESEEQKEVNKMDVGPTDMDSNPHESVSDNHSNLEVLEHVHDSKQPGFGIKQHADLGHAVDINEDAVCSPTCYISEVRTIEHLEELPGDQISVESVCAVMDEAKFELLDLQSTPPCRLAETGVASEQSLELQSDQLDGGCWQPDEASPKSSDLQPEQIKTASDIGEELNETMLSSNPFDSVFPSFGVLPENLGEMPPLPPLPPMQWRLGKVQPAPLALLRGWIDNGEGTLAPIQPFTADEKSPIDILSSGREIMQPSNPFLSFNCADIQKPQQSYAELVENSLQPSPLSLEMPAVTSNANSQEGSHALEGVHSWKPFLTSPEITNDRPEDGLIASGGTQIGSFQDLLSPLATIEHIPSEHDPVPSHGLETKLLNQVMSESILEAKEPEHSLQNSEEEERDSLDESVSLPTMLDDHRQHDPVTLHGETTWAPSTLALPPIYEVGKPNGSKPPRPRILSLMLLLHMTKASEKGIQGPKTNLKVAAILESNAIRQAFAGSEENDSDSWSDSEKLPCMQHFTMVVNAFNALSTHVLSLK
ncbi:hypothetical protein GH714_034358 [Hevea brasiliensis]|uniref:Protein SCAR n=1 Tax=Hevea brasiliensis TaxID=3981 RepID=A0A6A6M6K5_HEVBR|nr:hypothetical protein GH714_034358 [Hevea brasiliensis]